MTKAVAFDLETIPDIDRAKELPEIELKINKRLKDPEKVQADLKIAKVKKLFDEEDQFKKMSFDPMWGQVCVFSSFDGEDVACFSLNEENNERDFLARIWSVLGTYNKFITFNGIQFDVPFLIGRSFINRVKPSVSISCRKYYVENHIDTMMLLKNWDTHKKGKLNDYCKLVLGEQKTEGIDGSMVWEYWQQGRYDELKKYATQDTKLTYELGMAMKGYYF